MNRNRKRFAPIHPGEILLEEFLAGMVAHIEEGRNREKPMRRIHPSDHEYDGSTARSRK